MPAASGLPPIGSFWIGDELRWIDRLALASFRHHGHAVTLFHAGPRAPRVPDGVMTCPAAEVFDPAPLLGNLPAASVADIFRLRLNRQTDMIWVDTDALCLRPLVLPDSGYLVGREDPKWINNAVLRLPPDSPALAAMLAAFVDPAIVPVWLDEPSQAAVRAKPAGERLAETCRQSPNALGPRALTHFLLESGEDRHALPARALNPLPWHHGEVVFNPHGGADGWITPDTLVLHLFASRLRKPHMRRRPPIGSYLSQFAFDIGFDA